MYRFNRLILAALMCVTALAFVAAADARTPDRETGATALRATPQAFRKLEADFSIYDWRKSETPRDLIGTMTVYARGGDGHYTYEFVGLHDANTFDFRWRACTTLVNSLRVWSGDGQRIDVPVWRDNLPCPKHWRGEEDN